MAISVPIHIDYEKEILIFAESLLDNLKKELESCKLTRKSKITGLKHAIKVQKLKIKRINAKILAYEFKHGDNPKQKHELISKVEARYNVIAENLNAQSLATYIGAL